MFLTTNK